MSKVRQRLKILDPTLMVVWPDGIRSAVSRSIKTKTRKIPERNPRQAWGTVMGHKDWLLFSIDPLQRLSHSGKLRYPFERPSTS